MGEGLLAGIVQIPESVPESARSSADRAGIAIVPAK